MHVLSARMLLPVILLVVDVSVLYAGAADASRRSGPGGYVAFNYSSLGGSSSAGISINDRGLVTGYSNLEGDQTRHATAWLYGLTFDLGTLGGPNSGVLWPVKNDKGVIAGIAETDELDPLGASWSCSAFFPGDPTGHTCLGFVWERGAMEPLPTFGGNNGFAAGVNNSGQVVGWAENTFHDPTCNAPQVLQFRAALWEPDRDEMHELPPLPGNTTSAATAINDRGQVVGFSNVSADDEGAFNARAFLWTEDDGIQDLGTLPGDAMSQALGINNLGQVVGMSCAAGFASCRAFLWQDGVMLDLNALVGLGYDDHLYFANDINDFGMITGQAVDDGTDASVPFFALPMPGRGHGGFNADVTLPAADASERSAADLLPEQVRAALLLRLGLADVETWDK